MENHSFETEIASGNPLGDPNDSPPGSSETEPQANIAGTSRDPPNESEPAYSVINDDNHESPPAYMQRHLPQEKKIDDLQELEPPPAEPVQEAYDVRKDPEFQQRARNRRERRSRQLSVEGPCSLRSDANMPPLPQPESYPEPDQPQDQAPAISSTPRTSSSTFQNVYRKMCRFSFQFPFHTLLLTWPLATASMGVLNLNYCPINLLLPYVMLVVGTLGSLTIFVRLCMLYFDHRIASATGQDHSDSYWTGLRVAELIIWVFFVTQLIYFFQQAPSFTQGSRNYCKERYYKINCCLMFLTSLTMFGWLVVHVSKLINWLRRRNAPAYV